MAKDRDAKHIPADFAKKNKELQNEFDVIFPRRVGEIHVQGFQKSFDMQSFNDSGQAPWEEVLRRTKGQGWYGFAYKSNSPVPKGARGGSRRYGSRGGKTNYSPRAATRNILLGSGSGTLRNSIFLAQANRGLIIVASPMPYAELHNEGGTGKIFGRHTSNVPKRKFMGHSRILDKQSERLMTRRINKIFDQ